MDNSKSTVHLELPDELKQRHIHLTFHTNLIRPHVANDDIRFPNREAQYHYELGHSQDDEWFVDKIIGHRWTNENQLELLVKWTLGDTKWEPIHECNKLEALERYLEIQGVKAPQYLHKRR